MNYTDRSGMIFHRKHREIIDYTDGSWIKDHGLHNCVRIYRTQIGLKLNIIDYTERSENTDHRLHRQAMQTDHKINRYVRNDRTYITQICQDLQNKDYTDRSGTTGQRLHI